MTHRILIVDDQAAIRFAMAEYLAARGYRVDCAPDQETAKQLIVEQEYAVVITDLRLMGSDDTQGMELIEWLSVRSTGTRTILLTAYGAPAVEREASRRGADVCLDKPIPMAELALVVRRLIEKAAPD